MGNAFDPMSFQFGKCLTITVRVVGYNDIDTRELP